MRESGARVTADATLLAAEVRCRLGGAPGPTGAVPSRLLARLAGTRSKGSAFSCIVGSALLPTHPSRPQQLRPNQDRSARSTNARS